MAERHIQVIIDDKTTNSGIQIIIAQVVSKNGEILYELETNRTASPEEISETCILHAGAILEDERLSKRDRRDKYDLLMEASKIVPGLDESI